MENVGFVLAVEAEDDEAGVAVERVGSDIRKPAIKGDDDSVLRHTDLFNSWIVFSSEVLFDYAGSVPASVAEKLNELLRQVLVHLEAHHLRRKCKDFLAGEIGRVGDARLNCPVRETRIAG